MMMSEAIDKPIPTKLVSGGSWTRRDLTASKAMYAARMKKLMPTSLRAIFSRLSL